MQKKKVKSVHRNSKSKGANRKVKVPSLAELGRQITPSDRYREIPMGPPRGKELLAILKTLKPLDEDSLGD